jgi:hypothetical protein
MDQPNHQAREDAFHKALDGLNKMTRDFIKLCIHPEPSSRPKAHILLKQPVLQEVFNLKLLSAYALRSDKTTVRNQLDKLDFKSRSEQTVLATIPSRNGKPYHYIAAATPQIDVEKFFDEISQDLLLETEVTVDSPQKKDEPGARIIDESNSLLSDRSSVIQYNPETRQVTSAVCHLKSLKDNKKEIYIKLQFGNKSERELKSELQDDDTPQDLVNDLVNCGLLAIEDKLNVIDKLTEAFNSFNN